MQSLQFLYLSNFFTKKHYGIILLEIWYGRLCYIYQFLVNDIVTGRINDKESIFIRIQDRTSYLFCNTTNTKKKKK